VWILLKNGLQAGKIDWQSFTKLAPRQAAAGPGGGAAGIEIEEHEAKKFFDDCKLRSSHKNRNNYSMESGR
jgi:hypothetical protein